MVISHGGDEKTICGLQADKGKELGRARMEGNLPRAQQGGHQGLGQGGGHGSDIHQGDVFEEEVHGRVQAGVHRHGGHHGDVPQKRGQVNQKEGSSAEQLYLRDR